MCCGGEDVVFIWIEYVLFEFFVGNFGGVVLCE